MYHCWYSPLVLFHLPRVDLNNYVYLLSSISCTKKVLGVAGGLPIPTSYSVLQQSRGVGGYGKRKRGVPFWGRSQCTLLVSLFGVRCCECFPFFCPVCSSWLGWENPAVVFGSFFSQLLYVFLIKLWFCDLLFCAFLSKRIRWSSSWTLLSSLNTRTLTRR